MKFGVVSFPGSNCDHDALTVASSFGSAEKLWHKDTAIPAGVDCVILPGGFSYGDYLRCGAVARFSPIMTEVIKFANAGGLVIGICNGFQILTESGLLPGALVRNSGLSFICKDVFLKTENKSTAFTSAIEKDVIRIPVAHGEGNFIANEDLLKELKDNNQIAFRYCSANGDVSSESNPNGSTENIAGIFNKNKNVLGLMPHPERYSESLLGGSDGQMIFKSILNSLN